MQQIVEDKEISLSEVLHILRRKWLYLTIIPTVLAAATFIMLLFLPNIYSSTILLLPRNNAEEGLGGMSNKLSAVTALTGFKLGGGTQTEITAAVETLKSRKFITKFVEERNIKIDLFAIKKWDGEKEVLNESIYNLKEKKWVRDFSSPQTLVPSSWEVYEEFSEILSFEENKEGIIRVGIEHKSPRKVKNWLTWMVEDINHFMKERKRNELQNSLVFLDEKIREVDMKDLKLALYELLAEQTKKMMMLESREDYIFEVIDPAYIPEEHIKPKRLLISIGVFLLFGLIISALFIYKFNQDLRIKGSSKPKLN